MGDRQLLIRPAFAQEICEADWQDGDPPSEAGREWGRLWWTIENLCSLSVSPVGQWESGGAGDVIEILYIALFLKPVCWSQEQAHYDIYC